MKATQKSSSMDTLFESVERLLGRTPENPELQTLLEALDMWPLPDFEDEELTIYLEDKPRGFCLVFDESSSVQHPVAAGKPAGTPIFVGTFLYNEDVEDYRAFRGKLPHGITWADNAESLVAKLGPPKREIRNKRDGKLSAHGWPCGQWWLTASYVGGGSSMDHLDLNIF
jgi:hypothetical protein